MSSFGLLTTGFTKKTLQDILDELESAQKAKFGDQINTQATSVLGQLNGVFGDKLRELWDVAQAVNAAQNPESASGAALDSILAITGLTRLDQAKSKVTLNQLNLDNGATVPLGSVVSVGANGNRFVTTAAVTNSTGNQGIFSVAAESEEFGAIIGNARTIDTIQTPITGWNAQAAIASGNAETYALSDGQTLLVKVNQGAVQTATFNTADFAAIGAATAAEVAAVIQTDVTGVTASAQGGKVFIESDTVGTGSAIEITGGTANTALGFATSLVKGFNSLDATLGRNVETDAAARQRREASLQLAATSTVEAIIAELLQVAGVTEATVFENTTDVTDPDGIPPHAFEAIVVGGTDVAVAQAIFDAKPAGIGTSGSTAVVVTDSQGIDHTIRFTRPTELLMYVAISLDAVTETYGSGSQSAGDTLVKEAITNFGNKLGAGDDVIIQQFECAPLDSVSGVAGVVEVTAMAIEANPAPTNTANIAVGIRQIAKFDTGRVTVTSTLV